MMLKLLLVALLASALPEAEARRGKGNTIRVKSDQSIQAAIESAQRGSRIVVDAGTYAEQLLIKTDGIALVGDGAILTPPGSPITNECTNFAGPIDPTTGDTPSQAGICVAGGGLDLEDFKTEHKRVRTVQNPVKGVSITGFTVSGFSGFNILVVGGENIDVYGNILLDGPKYGFLTAGSTNTQVSKNEVTSTIPGFYFIGICMDNFSKVRVSGNKISKYYIGLCIQTDGAEIKDNEVSEACFGAFFDPGVRNVRFRDNKLTKSQPACAPFGAAGIILDGAIGACVENNCVENWVTDDPKTAGIVVADDPCSGGAPSLACLALNGPAIATDNRVSGNTLRDNTLDIFVNSTGTGNEFKKNDCKTSNVEGICPSD